MSAIKGKLEDWYENTVLSNEGYQRYMIKVMGIVFVAVLAAAGLREALKEGVTVGLTMLYR